MKKKILLICPEFNNYENRIINELEIKGYLVDLIIEKKSGFLFELLYKYLPKVNNNLQVKYLSKELRLKKENSYSKIIVIRGEYVTSEVSKLINNYFNDAEVVFYQWDSVKNNPIILEHLGKGYKVATFDCSDAKTHEMPYLPLFFCEEGFFQTVKFDLFFLGSYTPERFSIIKKLIVFCDENNLRYKLKLRASFFPFLKGNYNKIFDNSFFKYLKAITFSTVKYDDVIRDMRHSNVILDISHSSQSGFTMRTIEALGLNVKLLTNNPSILNAEFFQEDMIFFSDFNTLDRSKILHFIIKRKNSIYKKRENYSLSNWIDSLLSL